MIKKRWNNTSQPRIWSDMWSWSLNLCWHYFCDVSFICQGHYHDLSLFAPLTTATSVVQDGQTYCRRRPCDCGDPDEDLFCCPGCDNRPSSQCLDQSGRTLYRSGASWLYGCQQCRCVVRTQKHTHTLTHIHMCYANRNESWPSYWIPGCDETSLLEKTDDIKDAESPHQHEVLC